MAPSAREQPVHKPHQRLRVVKPREVFVEPAKLLVKSLQPKWSKWRTPTSELLHKRQKCQQLKPLLADWTAQLFEMPERSVELRPE